MAETVDEVNELPALCTSGGVVLTDEVIQQLANEAEAGYEPHQLRERRRDR